jgi:hypothetical protein
VNSTIRVALFGLLAGLALVVVIVVTAADNGPTLTSWAQGLGIGAVVAAGPVGVLVSDGAPSTIVALGGGMTLAGAATTPGGFLMGLPMAVVGVALMFTGLSVRSPLDWRLVGSTVGYAIVLVIGIYAGLAAGIGTATAVTLAVIVAISPKWIGAQGPPN